MSLLTRAIFADAEIAACFDDASVSAAMVRVEAALAEVQGRLGVIPEEAGAAIVVALAEAAPDPQALASGVATSGVPVPALVAQLRATVGPPHADWVHYGATSQDIVDTALMLCCRAAHTALAARVTGLLDALQALSEAHRDTVMLGRTRGQLATPITFGLKAAQWAQPLIASEGAALRFSAQFGGASGSRSALGAQGGAVARDLSEALALSNAPPWHTDRRIMTDCAQWLTGVTTALAKLAGDAMILARGEVAELRIAGGGGSSTMPHKSNPVAAEAVLAAHQSALTHAQGLQTVHAEERDGVAWPLEWLLLPQVFEATGAALSHAQRLVAAIQPNAAAMAQRIADIPAVMAEAAVFTLAPELGRQAAEALVKEAIAAPEPLHAALASRAPQVDWGIALDPSRAAAPASEIAAEIFALR
jgi:3-carboxy-cis,cis-muconate cycloisomerase